MKPIQLVICDIDNTLVPKHHNVSARTHTCISQLKKKGIGFGLASGRSIDQLHILEEMWNIQCEILIGLNGSEIYDGIAGTTETLYSMEPEWIRQCLEILAPFPCNPTLGRNGVAYVRSLDQNVSSSAAFVKNKVLPHVVKDDSEFWQQPAAKIGFRVRAEDMEAIEKRVAEYPMSGFVGFKTENTMFEFCNAKASKGALLLKFCQNHHIDTESVWAFGDMTNDISMLQAAGVGVCMLNGSEDTKAAADLITEKSVEDEGWADFVEKHILAKLD